MTGSWVKRLKRVVDRKPSDSIGKKNFAGNVFDRFDGLDAVFDRAAGCSLLDIACCEGLVSYEFARRGIRLTHGFERDNDRVQFAQRLFRDVPVESRFIQTDLARNGERFTDMYRQLLLPRYDIVLFLGIYHHLEKQMPESKLVSLVDQLMTLADKWFVVRTDSLLQIDRLAQKHHFELIRHEPRKGSVGILKVFERSCPTTTTQ